MIITLWPDVGGFSSTQKEISATDLANLIGNSHASDKKQLGLLKLAEFGNHRSIHNSLRNDENVRAIWGIEADYDQEVMTFADAVEVLHQNNIGGIAYTSPSHTEPKPRWRILCPFSKSYPPSERARFLARLNGLLNGVIGPESFTLSQSYYYGYVGNGAERPSSHRVEIVSGEFIDLRPDLDGGARGKTGKPSNGGTQREPLDYDAKADEILSGAVLHTNMNSLVASYSARGWPKEACVEYAWLLYRTANQERYQGRWPEILRLIDWAYSKDAEKEQTQQQSGEIYTAAELESKVFPPVATVVEGLFVEGLTLLASKPKTGKSWLVIHAAQAVANFGKTLGELTCSGGDVLYAALEDDPPRMQRRLRKLNLPTGWPTRLHFVHQMPRLTSGGVKFLTDWMNSVKDPRLIVIDTLEFVRDRPKNGENSYAADYAVGVDLKRLASERHVAIVVVHHLRKAEADDPFDTVSGTLGLTAAADTVLIITRDGPGATANYTLHGKGRDLEQIERPLIFDRATCLWNLIGETPNRADPWQKKKTLTLLRRALTNALLDHGETIKPWIDAPAVHATREFSLRSEFYKLYPATEGSTAQDKTDARRKQFTRAIKTAIDASLLGTKEMDGIGFFWDAASRT